MCNIWIHKYPVKPTIALFIHDPKCSVQSGNGIMQALGNNYNFKGGVAFEFDAGAAHSEEDQRLAFVVSGSLGAVLPTSSSWLDASLQLRS